MRVNLRGIHRVKKRLANGERKEYFYAWRGGPRLEGEPGSPEFSASYALAHGNQREPAPDKLRSIIAKFKASPAMTKLAPRTQADYRKHISKIEVQFGDMPMSALNEPSVTADFMDWRDGMAKSPRQADYAFGVLMRILSWARGRGETTYRPPDRLERLYHADRSENIWTGANIDSFMAAAPLPLQRAMALALYTGQRQGDLLRLSWTGYDAAGGWIRLKQGKTGRKVAVRVHSRLRAVLAATPRTATTILTHSGGRPWSPNAFRTAWHTAAKRAGIEGLTFHDIRGTAVTRLAEAGCTHAEIATITGHSLRDVGAILDRYLSRTDALSSAAIEKLERGGQ